jgi:diketogulonate reductase-like aldo/keto reductase
MPDIPRIDLNDGTSMPILGFGVFKVPAEEAARTVGEALRVGYRSIDTAWGYFNEEGVGQAIRDSGIPRDEIHVTTKVWNSYQGREKATESFERSLETLGLERLDLLLIHWPAPANDLYVETWETFIELRDSGRVTSIGVSNFEPEHLGRIIEATGVIPALNQVELHPYLSQQRLRDFHDLHGIVTEAWGPIARGRVVDDPVLVEIGARHGKSSVQVALRWEIQHRIVTIPKSDRPERIASNLDVFDFELTPEEMAAVDGLHRDERTGPHPHELN